MKATDGFWDDWPEDWTNDKPFWAISMSMDENDLHDLSHIDIQPKDPLDYLLKLLQKEVLGAKAKWDTTQQQIQTLISYQKQIRRNQDQLSNEIKDLREKYATGKG